MHYALPDDLQLLWMLVFAVILTHGPGRFAVDNYLWRKIK
jgi:hypothetical protein